MVLLSRQNGVGTILDEERGGERVSPQDSKVEETVARWVEDVQVAVVTDQSVGYALIAIQQGKVEGDVPLVITLIQFLW